MKNEQSTLEIMACTTPQISQYSKPNRWLNNWIPNWWQGYFRNVLVDEAGNTILILTLNVL